MAQDISEIKHIRKKLGLTQAELAKQSGVSQSLITKIEAGLLDPSFSNARKIFDALEGLSKKKEMRAEQVMETKIIHAHPDETPLDVVKKMKKHEISQLPVVENDSVVGFVSESIMLGALIENKKGKIRDIMNDAPPTVSKDSAVSMVSDLLKHYPIVVVVEKGKLKGIITRSDLLRKVYSK